MVRSESQLARFDGLKDRCPGQLLRLKIVLRSSKIASLRICS
jgi:hypothetical protein